jgi:hypothetical protein
MQALLLHLYVDGSDQVLWHSLCTLLTVVAVIELADGLQTVLGGVVQVRTAMTAFESSDYVRGLAGLDWAGLLQE